VFYIVISLCTTKATNPTSIYIFVIGSKTYDRQELPFRAVDSEN